jgi:hypothetical protein
MQGDPKEMGEGEDVSAADDQAAIQTHARAEQQQCWNRAGGN